MKNEPQMGAARSADGKSVRDGESTPFQIRDVKVVSYGAKSLEFTIVVPVIGEIEADLFTPDGRAPFVVPRSIRDKHTGGWQRTVRFDNDFALNVLAVVQQSSGTKERADD